MQRKRQSRQLIVRLTPNRVQQQDALSPAATVPVPSGAGRSRLSSFGPKSDRGETESNVAVEARFKVSRVSPWDEDGNTGEVEMTPDYADGKNKEWSEFTLSGVCRLSITNPDAFTQFVEGAAVAITLDITPPA